MIDVQIPHGFSGKLMCATLLAQHVFFFHTLSLSPNAKLTCYLIPQPSESWWTNQNLYNHKNGTFFSDLQFWAGSSHLSSHLQKQLVLSNSKYKCKRLNQNIGDLMAKCCCFWGCSDKRTVAHNDQVQVLSIFQPLCRFL